jgi:uncharacterized membrane protein YccC
VRNVAALKTAARAAIVIPAVFALADKVIEKPQTSILAAFGSFAILVLTEFAGPPRIRLAAYSTFAVVGASFITIGTLCSRNEWLAAGAMAVVGFLVLFSGVISGYFAAGATGAILLFVLPVTIPAPNSAIPDRLEGWGLACGFCIAAVMLLWPPRGGSPFAHEAAQALGPVAALAESGDDDFRDRARDARAAVDRLARLFLGTQHRPTGPAGATAALAGLPDELDWLVSLLAPLAEELPLALVCHEDREALAAIGSALRACAARLDGGPERPDIQRLLAAKDEVARALVARLPRLPDDAVTNGMPKELEAPFRIRAAAYATAQVSRIALLATGAEAPEIGSTEMRQTSTAIATLEATEQLAVEHANVGSVWFQNSLRGAVGLAIAVYIAQRSGLQHSFWVVLGTLSVLRSNALGTGWSIVSALAGTAVGIVVGALLVIGIGTHETVLWIVLPFAILVATYAPRAISFAAGQAAFTVVLFILFNIIQPVGWRVGLVRVEDVAIGFAISLGVGLLFWPRGAAALVREDLASAYARAIDFVVATAEQIVEGGYAGDTARTGRAADAAVHRLDDAFRQYLTERSASDLNVESVAALVGGAARVRRSGQSLAQLARMADGKPQLERCGEKLDREIHALQSWYVSFGYALANERPAAPPHIRDNEGRTQFFACVREATRNGSDVHGVLAVLWASQHLDYLWRLEGHLGEKAAELRSVADAPAPMRALRLLRGRA